MSKNNNKEAKDLAWKEFQETYNDNELHDRYTTFVRNAELYKDGYNEEVKRMNAMLEEHSSLSDLIVLSVKNGIMPTEASDKMKALEVQIGEAQQRMSELKAKFDREDSLVQKYKESTESKMFHYWCMLKAVDPELKKDSWMNFKQKYGNKIW